MEPFDLSRLTDCEREVWDEFSADSKESLVIQLWGFGYACMLECAGPPAVVVEKLKELDPDNLVLQYLVNVRRARGS